ncbi:cytochrome c [Sinimarinibacterium sp. CAU 1509]|uniref:c-type cytochrome n=1 Tax=Sinimarinibacterium sp. CAU 1509 TaxID=2562283 RepID=UPI0010AB6388|nr:cytochrome c [Sinimarinibacterium sp. CAU 1509]TJY59802.1 cytochrome c [Sinimarinibacterium sp. CAU 1509]
MNCKFPLRTLLVALPIMVTSVPAAANNGQELHDTNCTSCHDTSVYTRDNRRVKDLDGLHKQVLHCEQANSLAWSEQDVDAVASFLNKNYYKF